MAFFETLFAKASYVSPYARLGGLIGMSSSRKSPMFREHNEQVSSTRFVEVEMPAVISTLVTELDGGERITA